LLDFIDALDYRSGSFALFAGIAFLAFSLTATAARRYVLLAFNLVFLANLLSAPALLLYALLSGLVYFCGLAIHREGAAKRVAFGGCVALLVGLFFVLRDPSLREAIGASLDGSTSMGSQVAVVVGYSYFMFKSINFLIASQVGSIKNYSFLNFANFMFFFSSFTAGPIGRYIDYQEDGFGRRASTPEIFDGLQRIFTGLIKKYVFVDLIAQFSLAAFDSPYEMRSVAAAWFATLAYLVYVYVDLSAYTDIAIGFGLLFGVPLPENFNYPLFKRNLVLFWENWHMSLTSWIRDHVFTPLNWRLLERGGFSPGRAAPMTPYIATMVIFGIWHAPTLPFLVFGAIQGLALSLTQRAIAFRRKHLSPAANQSIETGRLSAVLGAIATSTFVAVSLILIRYDLSDSLTLMQFLFTGTLR